MEKGIPSAFNTFAAEEWKTSLLRLCPWAWWPRPNLPHFWCHPQTVLLSIIDWNIFEMTEKIVISVGMFEKAKKHCYGEF